ncbi:MAG: nuclease-related domain-containing protein, partial [Pseudomonadota bacterium]
VTSAIAIVAARGLERLLSARFSLFERWAKGARSEAAVGLALEQLRPEFLVLHDIAQPGEGNVDHLVAGPTGVYVIETKHRRFEKPQLLKVRRQAAKIHDELGVWVTPVICLDRPFAPRVYNRVTVVGRPELAAWIRAQHNRTVPFEVLARFADGLSSEG